MSASRTTTSARLINLVVPGGGLILIGSETVGMLIAALFTVAANFAIAVNLLFPDELSSTWRGLGIGVTLGTYIGAQVRYAQTVRWQRARTADELRQAALRDARAALSAGRVEDAWHTLQPLVGQAASDLALAYRLAQVLTARGDWIAARAAWRRVRRLDRHRVYSQEIAENERTLSKLADSSDSLESGEA